MKPGEGVRLNWPILSWRILVRHRVTLIAVLALLLLAGCGPTSALNPQGPRSVEISRLWWIMFGLGTAAYLLVMGVLLYGLFRRRHDAPLMPGSQEGESRRGWIIAGGIVLPAILLVIVYTFTVRTLGVLAAPDQDPAFNLEVVGHQWWWEIRYPDHGFTTANEIHIPVGQPVQVQLSSIDVIHSFWVPELMGKLDLVPGQTNTVWIQADEPGEYLGECAEYCGTQHAKMRFLVIAEPPDLFADWADGQQRPAPEPATEEARAGQQVFLGAVCVSCHTIEGTNASGVIGPDLTHLASRRTLGAGIVPNNRGNLAGWIINSQSIKPGNRMPPMFMSSEDLQALLAYLATLE